LKKQGYLVCIKPDGTETREPFKGREAPYERLRALIGGIITSVKVKPDDGSIARVGFVHDEGLLIGLPYNARASRMYDRACGDGMRKFDPSWRGHLVGPLVYTYWETS
jgi:hypothetical protein